MNISKSKIEELLYNNASDFEIAKVIKADIKEYFETLPELYRETGGKNFLVKHTHKIDTIIKLVYKISLRSMFGNYMPMTNVIPVTLAALGSYGREQLCVHSDIDLMIVYEDIPAYNIKELIEKMLYLFWDIGLKLGHRVHELSQLEEAARSDITIKSAILESRYIEGSKSLWAEVENKITLIRKDDPKSYIYAKLQEQRDLHKRFPLTMEPNLKEGVGGFRDANLVFWLGKLLYNVPRIRDLPEDIVNDIDYKRFGIALEFLFRVRSALHLATGKKEDHLRLELIPQISSMLGYRETPSGQMKFAKKNTESLRIIYLYGKIWTEAMLRNITPELYEKYLMIQAKENTLGYFISALNKHANTAFRAHPKLLQYLTHAKKPDHLDENLLKVISDIFNQANSYCELEALHTARLLKYVIPPLKKVTNLPQFDGYHNYSVDMHLLKALWYLENIDDKLLQDMYAKLSKEERHLLKIIVLLHDSGKGRKKDHALVSVSLFRIFANKLGIDTTQIEMGVRLIRYHDLMSVTAQREDLYSEKTILQFASIFNTKKQLDMIYLLTYADMSGVGGNIYNSFTAKLLHKLYQESILSLAHNKILSMTTRKLKKIASLKNNKDFLALTKGVQKKLLSIQSNELFVFNSTNRILAITKTAATTDEFSYYVTHEPTLMIEIIIRKNLNVGYLLSKLSRINILHLQIAKLFNNLKYFRIEFAQSVDESEIDLIKNIIEDSFDQSKKVKLQKPIIKRSEIEIECNHSREYGALKIGTKDQKGLLAYLMYIFDKLDIDIASTKIHTGKHRVNDLFLIQKNGNFCNNTERIIEQLTE